MTVYAKFIEHGAINESNPKTMQIGASGGGDARFIIEAVGGYYRAHHDPGTGVTSTLAAAPSIGNAVELLAVLASDGSVQISQSLDAAAATTASQSSVATLLSTWSDTVLWLGNHNGGYHIYNPINALVVTRGSHTLADFRDILP
jgi:hypothetical protein